MLDAWYLTLDDWCLMLNAGSLMMDTGVTPVWCRGGKRYVDWWWGLPCSKSREMGKIGYHVFDRYEIHIQAFVDFIHGKLMSGHSSSSTFHDFQEFIISNYQKIRNSEFQKSTNGQLMFPAFRNLWVSYFHKKYVPRCPRDVPWFFLIFSSVLV